MNKSELIDAVAAKAGLTKADAGKAIDAFTGTVTSALAAGHEAALKKGRDDDKE